MRSGAAAETPADAGVRKLSFLAGFKRVLGHRPFRGVLLTRIVTDPAWFFLIYWHPGFLQERGGWALADVGRWTWMMPAAAALANVFVGSWSDRLFQRSGDAPAARRAALQRLAWLAPCFALAPLATGIPAVVLVLLVLCYLMANTWLTITAVLGTEVAPPGMVATAIATLSALGGATSVAFNYVAGPLIDLFGYATMFVACACLHPLGAWILQRFYGRPPIARTPTAKP
jgi:MFS transporter, ACS family, hexuronate transporter